MSQHDAIIQLHCAGKTNPEIIKLLKAPRSTVWKVVKRYQDLGTTSDWPRCGRPRTARTSVIKERIRRNLKRSMRKMAKSLDMDEKSVRTIVKEDLKLSPFKMTNRQQLTDLQKQKRLDRSKILLNAMKDGTQAGEIVFSDEKMFTVEAKFNSQNDRILAKSADSIPPSVKTVFRRQKPASVMVWAAISESWRFSSKKALKLTQNRISRIFWLQDKSKWRSTLRTDLLLFNRTVRPRTQTKKYWRNYTMKILD